MTTRNILIALGIAAALAAGVGTYSSTASAQDGPGYGPRMMDGYGPGYGRGPVMVAGRAMAGCAATAPAIGTCVATAAATPGAAGTANIAPATAEVTAAGDGLVARKRGGSPQRIPDRLNTQEN